MPTGYANASDLIIAAFKADWATGAYSTTRVVYDNEKAVAGINPYIQVIISPGAALQMSIAKAPGRVWRQLGIVTAAIYTIPGQGTKFAEQLADAAASILRGRSIGGVIFRAPRLNRVGVVGEFMRHNLTTDFYFDLTA